MRWGDHSLALAGLLAESIWLYALIATAIAMTIGGAAPSYPAVGSVVIASFLLARVAVWEASWRRGIPLSTSIGSLLIFFAIVRVDIAGDLRVWDTEWVTALAFDTSGVLGKSPSIFFAVPLLAAIWVNVARRGMDPSLRDISTAVGIGFVVLPSTVLMAEFDESVPRDLAPLAVAYFPLGLLALGLALGVRSGPTGLTSLSPGWTAGVGAAILVVSGSTLLAVLGMGAVGYDTLEDGLILLGRGLGLVFAAVMYVLTWPLFAAIEVLGARPDLGDIERSEREPLILEESEPFSFPPWLSSALDVLLAVLIGSAAAALAFALVVAHRRYRATEDPGSMRQTLSPRAGFRGLRRFAGLPWRGVAPHWPAQEMTRRLYYEMVYEGRRRGIEPRPMETPYELSRRLERVLGAQPLGEVTMLFADVRYGHIPPNRARVEELRQEWERSLNKAQG